VMACGKKNTDTPAEAAKESLLIISDASQVRDAYQQRMIVDYVRVFE